uniref:Uncharacterized protein n=1 Tax=Tetranychus urticae TaxID=32264 RepID=T1JPN6_TETUR
MVTSKVSYLDGLWLMVGIVCCIFGKLNCC